MTTGTLSLRPRSSRRLMSRSCCVLQTRMSFRQSGLLPLAHLQKLQDKMSRRKDELSSSDVLDVTVFNLGNLTRQTIQHQAEPRMLRLIMNQTSHIMMFVTGTSLAANQRDQKLRDANWAFCSSDDGHHWFSVCKAENETQIRKLVDNCGSEHQKIWYTVFEVKFGLTSTCKSVYGRAPSLPFGQGVVSAVQQLFHCSFLPGCLVLRSATTKTVASMLTL